ETPSAWCFDLAGCVGVDTGPLLLFAGEGLAYEEAADRWSTLPENEYADPFLDGKATAWTGRLAVVWGGGSYEAEEDAPPARVAPGGAAYDPSATTWTALPAAPVPTRARARAVWTGAEFIVWGGESGYAERTQFADGAAWTP
ncbi:MAG TPA: hypothetical protein VI854_01675, partial [Acidimicrobiia bacterium]|nr:hypothetical protein [Acidimicrobiia bacterium]